MKKGKALSALLIAVVMFGGACGSSSPAVTSNTPATNPPTTSGSTTTDTPSTTTETTTTEVAPTETPFVMGEGFTTYFAQDYGTLNYYKSNKSVDAEEGFCHFIEPLIQTDKFGRLAPDVATEWSCSPDGLVWTIKLRNDAMWVRSDGSDYGLVTAHDFVAGIKQVLDPEVASVTLDFVTDFVAGAKDYFKNHSEGDKTASFDTVGVKAVDDFTLQYTMVAPTPFFPSLLTYTTYLPVSQKFLDEVGADKFGLDKDSILYSGSFILTEWTKDTSRTLERNEKYFDANRVHVPFIKFFAIPDGQVAIELYKRGEISAAGIGADYLDAMMADPLYKDYLFVTNPTSASWYYGFNSASANKDFATASLNQSFREALFHSFNRNAMLLLSNPYDTSKMQSGIYSSPGISVTPAGKDYVTFGNLPKYTEDNLNNLDVAKAQAAMAKAKEELGSTVSWPITVKILGTAAPASERLNAIIRQSFEEAFPGDIKVETVIYTSDTYYTVMEQNGFDFTSSGWSADYADPSAYLATVLPGHDVDRFGFGNFPEMEEYVKLYNEAMAITDDADKRFAKFAEAEEILYKHCLIIPFRYNGGNWAINNIQNPYDAPRSGYGLSASKFIDRIYGTEPITAEVREEQRVKYEQERAELSK